MLGLIVEMGGMSMDFGKVTGQETLLAIQLLVHNITIHTPEEVILRLDEEFLGGVPCPERGFFALLE